MDAVNIAAPGVNDEIVKLTLPLVLEMPGAIRLIVSRPPLRLDVRATAWPITGWSNPSNNCTVTVDVVMPSAAMDSGQAVTVERLALTHLTKDDDDDDDDDDDNNCELVELLGLAVLDEEDDDDDDDDDEEAKGIHNDNGVKIQPAIGAEMLPATLVPTAAIMLCVALTSMMVADM